MNMTLPRPIASFVGALLIPVADLSLRMNGVDSGKAGCSLLNAAGSAMVSYIAVRPFLVGFIVLGVRWESIGGYALARPRGLE
jgi:hypothetical protein